MNSIFIAPQNTPATSAMNRLRSSIWIRRGGTLAIVMLVGLPILLAFVPWQQNVVGSGRVIAFAPLDRQQSIEAPIDGRIVTWHVQEGSAVTTGMPLLEISDIDPDLVRRLERENAALLGKISSYEDKLGAYEVQVEALETSRDLAVAAARFRLETAAERIRAAEQARVAARAKLDAAEAQERRMKRLLAEGIASRREFEVADRDANVARTDLAQAVASLRAAEADRASQEQSLEETRASADARIASTVAAIRETETRLQDARGSLARLEVRMARQQSQVVTAPRNGTVFRLVANQGGEIVRAGDPLLVLVPDTSDQAVELWISGNDAPLVAGRNVRLQFEGWPAVQFAGWPSVAVGTFGGRIALVDATDDGTGRFRVLVVPDPDDQPWPEQPYLRQGVRAKGWVLLDEVRLAYELWRQLNGFPPTIQRADAKPDLARKRLK